ncbi:valyl-tRNA synthetase, putative [Theileria annulata]|uniref:valine--tRNA ligase n=1 Tax=Theileria annulata TaxID=5874 RepID=Q4U9A6_THEAN|nr:valyl-tRNA synthetase, putative [Theileria annulata]CAI76597.1 valyl-tRNA synthetase, putative [Theileria annulata]|eukprot:XP_953222.1 valyl-tRNA synthetase, putative [Theileria annulata]
MNIILICIIKSISCIKTYNFINHNFLNFNINQDSTSLSHGSVNKLYDSTFISDSITKGENSLNNDKSEGTVRIITPPPNVTGDLHVGNLLNVVCCDVYKNYLKLKGFDVNINFSNDHAGQSFQKVFDNTYPNLPSGSYKMEMAKLMCQNIRNRHLEDIRKLGIDWEYGHFTMDKHVESLANSVLQRFKTLGLLKEKYWPTHCVNINGKFIPVCSSDIHYSNENITLHVMDKQFEDVNGDKINLKVCTPFQEYYYATTALGVPNDIFQQLKDHQVDLPNLKRRVPIIPISNEINIPNFLKNKNMALMLSNGYNYYNPDDEMVILDWNELLNSKVEDIFNETINVTMEVPKYTKDINGKVVILPVLQYVLDTKTLSKKALESLDKINVYPENRKTMIYNRLKNIKDWCITRHAWWGIKPIIDIGVDKNDNRVLDTWFTSSLWPIITWNGKTGTSILYTCYDILENWIVKMLLVCANIDEDKLFNEIYLHGMVSDQFGKKMSKSHQNTLVLKDLMESEQTSFDHTLFNINDPDEMIKSNLVRLKLCSICSSSDFTKPLNNNFNYQNILFKYYQIFKFRNSIRNYDSSPENSNSIVNNSNSGLETPNSSPEYDNCGIDLEKIIKSKLFKLVDKIEQDIKKFEFSNCITNLNEYVKVFSEFLVPLIRLSVSTNVQNLEHFDPYFSDLASIIYAFTPEFVNNFKLNDFIKEFKWPHLDTESNELFEELVNIVTNVRKLVKNGQDDLNIKINPKLNTKFNTSYINYLIQLTYNKLPKINYM